MIVSDPRMIVSDPRMNVCDPRMNVSDPRMILDSLSLTSFTVILDEFAIHNEFGA
jgi:hypothetical protein